MNTTTKRIKAFFPSLNKNNTLAEYKALTDGNWNEVEITDTLELSPAEWADFTENLLQDDERIAGKGGCDSDADVREVSQWWELTEEEQEAWKAESYILGVLVRNTDTGEEIIVDPQGYNYARYVGLLTAPAALKPKNPEPMDEQIGRGRVVSYSDMENDRAAYVITGDANGFGHFEAINLDNPAQKLHTSQQLIDGPGGHKDEGYALPETVVAALEIASVEAIERANEKERAERAERENVAAEFTFVAKHGGEVVEVVENPDFQHLFVEVVKGELVRIAGIYTNTVKGPQVFDRVFRIGDLVEYDSFNFAYTGEIDSISPKTVLVDKGLGYSSKTRMKWADFARRNWNFDAERIAQQRANWYD